MKRGSGLKEQLKETHLGLLLLCIIASAYGILMVYSATLRDKPADSLLSRESEMMIIAVAVGIVGAIMISYIDYELMIRLWPVIGGVCLLLMLLLFAIGKAPDGRSDSFAWIKIGSFYFQPSELVKVGFIITFGTHLTRVADHINKIKTVALLAVHGLVPIGLVILTGDLGSALVFIVIFIAMLFIAGLHLRYFVAVGLLGVAAVPVLWLKFFSSFQKERFLAVYYPSALSTADYERVIFQQKMGVNAIGSGQWFGKGLFQGPYTQGGLVPVNESDMVFSVVGEELGFVGCIGLLLLLFLIIFFIVRVAKKSRDVTGNYFCYGVAVMIAAQTIINIGMCLKLLPCIGITLPFISAGGSANLCIYVAIGLVMSVYRYNKVRDPVDFRMSRPATPYQRLS